MWINRKYTLKSLTYTYSNLLPYSTFFLQASSCSHKTYEVNIHLHPLKINYDCLSELTSGLFLYLLKEKSIALYGTGVGEQAWTGSSRFRFWIVEFRGYQYGCLYFIDYILKFTRPCWSHTYSFSLIMKIKKWKWLSAWWFTEGPITIYPLKGIEAFRCLTD